jgi:hypothetical protein
MPLRRIMESASHQMFFHVLPGAQFPLKTEGGKVTTDGRRNSYACKYLGLSSSLSGSWRLRRRHILEETDFSPRREGYTPLPGPSYLLGLGLGARGRLST